MVDDGNGDCATMNLIPISCPASPYSIIPASLGHIPTFHPASLIFQNPVPFAAIPSHSSGLPLILVSPVILIYGNIALTGWSELLVQFIWNDDGFRLARPSRSGLGFLSCLLLSIGIP